MKFFTRIKAAIRAISFQSQRDTVADHTQCLVNMCHSLALEAGWWHNPATGRRLVKLPVAEKLLLIHSEISEATEGFRKNTFDDHLPDRKTLEVELADALIRICDLAGALDIDLAGAVADKLYYNTQRKDHKLANRAKDDGKKF